MITYAEKQKIALEKVLRKQAMTKNKEVNLQFNFDSPSKEEEKNVVDVLVFSYEKIKEFNAEAFKMEVYKKLYMSRFEEN